MGWAASTGVARSMPHVGTARARRAARSPKLKPNPGAIAPDILRHSPSRGRPQRARAREDGAVRGRREHTVFAAGAELECLAGELEVDLVPLESANPFYLAQVAQTGMALT